MGMQQGFKRAVAFAAISLTLTSGSVMASVNDDIPTYTDKIYGSSDMASLKWEIITDPTFHKPLYYLGHYLGYGWSGGTASKYVGQDLVFNREDNNTYSIKAHYNRNDPYAGGYWADERLSVELSDVKFFTNPADLKLGEPQVYDREPLQTITAVVYNYGDTNDTAVTELAYQESQSWSKQDDFSFSESIGVSNEYKFDLGFMGNKTTITAEFSASQGWSETKGESSSISQVSNYSAQMPPRSKRYITLTLFKQVTDIPYTSEMYMSYNLKYYNFLRWGGNAHIDHPTNRPFYEYTFGTRNNLNAAEDILDQYLHRNINGYSVWDWQWMLNEYNASSIRSKLGKITKRNYGAQLTGKFSAVNGSQFNIEADAAIPLTEDELASRPRQSRVRRSLEPSSGNLRMEVVDVEDYSDDDTIQNVSFSLSTLETM